MSDLHRPATEPTDTTQPAPGTEHGPRLARMQERRSVPTRDSAAMFDDCRKRWGGHRDLWVFGYASLIWRPEFEAAERRPALLRGWHRALSMRSGLYRGTLERPGLVCALVGGGSCRGMVYRVERERGERELERLWLREMDTATYDPRWLTCRTPAGTVEALAFTLDRRSPAHLGVLDDAQIVDVLRHARGRFGSTLEYLVQTTESLRGCGIRDRELERLVELAKRHALIE